MMDEHMKNQLERIHAVVMRVLLELKRVCEQNDIQYFLAFGSLLGAVRHKGFIPWDDDIDIWMKRDNFKKLLQHKNEFGDAFELVLPEDYGTDKYADSNTRLCYKYASIKVNEDFNNFYGNKTNLLHIDIFLIDRTYGDIRGTVQVYELFLLYALMAAYRSKDFDYSHHSPAMRFAIKCFSLVGKCISLNWLRKRAAKVAERYDERSDTNIYKVTTDSFVGMKRTFPREALDKAILVDFEDTKVSIPQGYDAILKVIYGDYMKLPPKEEQIPHIGAWNNLENTKISRDVFVFEEPEEKS